MPQAQVLSDLIHATISAAERLARASTSPTRSDPEGSSRNESRLGRCPASHLIPYREQPVGAENRGSAFSAGFLSSNTATA